jgi:hypothetical protein
MTRIGDMPNLAYSSTPTLLYIQCAARYQIQRYFLTTRRAHAHATLGLAGQKVDAHLPCWDHPGYWGSSDAVDRYLPTAVVITAQEAHDFTLTLRAYHFNAVNAIRTRVSGVSKTACQSSVNSINRYISRRQCYLCVNVKETQIPASGSRDNGYNIRRQCYSYQET